MILKDIKRLKSNLDYLRVGNDIDDPNYPEEWTYDKEGKPMCTRFIDKKKTEKLKKDLQEARKLYTKTGYKEYEKLIEKLEKEIKEKKCN